MPLSPSKTWVEGEVLTAATLNAEFLRIYNDDGQNIGNPAVSNQDFDGKSLILDGDEDTILKASSDDLVEVTIQGATLFSINGDFTTPVNGFQITTAIATEVPSFDAFGNDTTIDMNLKPKGNTGVLSVDGTAYATLTSALHAYRLFGT